MPLKNPPHPGDLIRTEIIDACLRRECGDTGSSLPRDTCGVQNHCRSWLQDRIGHNAGEQLHGNRTEAFRAATKNAVPLMANASNTAVVSFESCGARVHGVCVAARPRGRSSFPTRKPPGAGFSE